MSESRSKIEMLCRINNEDCTVEATDVIFRRCMDIATRSKYTISDIVNELSYSIMRSGDSVDKALKSLESKVFSPQNH